MIRDVRLRSYLVLVGMAVTLSFGLATIVGLAFLGEWFYDPPLQVGWPPLAWCVTLRLLFTVVQIVLFMMWIFRSAHNARLLEGPRSEISPALAVGAFFIPVYNLVAPVIAMGKIANVFQRLTNGPSAWVGVWWAVWLLSALFPLIMQAVSPIAVLYGAAGGQAVSMMATAMLVIRMTRQQTQLFLNPQATDRPAPLPRGVMPVRNFPGMPPVNVNLPLPKRPVAVAPGPNPPA
jgi:hypothetical protein